MRKRISYLFYRFIKFWVWLFYPVTKVHGTENIPPGPVCVVGNHAKMNAPIACQLYFPGEFRIWTAGEMMHLREVPEYAYNDFWSYKPSYIRWFFRLLSYVIAPVSVSIFSNADCIGVYRDTRIMTTFRTSVRSMHEGIRIIILPEHDQPHNNIVCDFQENFVDIARMYYKKYREEISFVPMYTAPALRSVYLGKAVRYDASAPISGERTRICETLMDRVTELARSLPEHRVVPYPNIPRKDYPTNKEIFKEFSSNGLSDRKTQD